jgi:GntR family transcriptional regulator/MocR family aminotransferase
VIPYDSLIQLERNSSVALFVQLANQLIGLIKQGHLAVGTPLPSSRVLAETLGVHRKTIVAAYDELILQGWVETIPKKGTFVAFDIPQLQGSGKRMKTSAKVSTTPNFDWCSDPRLMPFEGKAHLKYHIDDGVSDSRWSPNALLGKLYRQVLLDPTLPDLMGYGDPKGNQYLREVLVGYLNETRGLGISTKNILITRGSQMGIHLSAKILVGPGDVLVVGETNYSAADISFENLGATLMRVPVDENGLDTKT